jgi:hypothetical protein
MPLLVPEFLAVQLENGILTENIPAGYLITPAPRRAARGRSNEILLTALDLHSRSVLPVSEADRVADRMAKVYFETPGSVTAALRACFTAANAEVLPFNQISSTPGTGAGVPQLNAICAVLRENDLFFVYAGDILVLVVRDSGVEQYPAPGDTPARALGITLNVDFRYGRSALTGPATLILAASPAPAWSASAPTGLARLSLRAIGERMAQQSASRSDSFGAFIVRFSETQIPVKSGSFLSRLRPNRAGMESPAQARTKTPAKDRPSLLPAAEESRSGPGDRRLPSLSGAPMQSSPTTAEPGPVSQSKVWEKPERLARQQGQPPAQKTPPASHPAAPGSAAHRLSIREGIAAFAHSARITGEAAVSAVRRFLAGLLPKGVLQKNDQFSMPPLVMLGTAIAIPLVVLSIVAVVYFRKGREMEFTRLMQEAQVEAAAARAQSDPLTARDAWQRTFDVLETASGYGTSDEFTTLLNQAARTLDSIDRIEPLEFQPAVAGNLEAGTRITGLIVTNDRELYALDSSHEKVIQLLPGKGGYQLGADFQCQAGTYPDITVGTLLDIAWVPDLTVGEQKPSSSRDGVVVAIDSNGVLLYCPPGGRAMAGALPPPRTGWSAPSAIEYYSGRLYVLDPGANGFWRYTLSENDSFDKTPTDYFVSEHPSITDVVDFTVAKGEVFFLHADGHVTGCMFDPLLEGTEGELNGGTQCKGIPFNDTRPGQTPGPRIKDAMLSRIFYNDYPEPSLFFLDPLGRGAFRFSLMLNFLSRYRVTVAPEDQEATAIAVGTDKVLYVAIGDQIYYAQPGTP